MKLFTHIHDDRFEFQIESEPGGLRLQNGRKSISVHLDTQPGAIRTAHFPEGSGRPARKIEFGWTRRGNQYSILIDGIVYEVTVQDARTEQAVILQEGRSKEGTKVFVSAPIPGRVTKILAPEGTKVARNQPVLTLDAMKLENEIQAPKEGVVHGLTILPGTAVEKGQFLFSIE